MTREKDIERYLVKQVEKLGGKAYKWVSPGNVGVPDRIVMLPVEVIVFVELKAKAGRLRTGQKVQRKRIAGMGFMYCFLNCKDDVDLMLMELGF